MITSPEKPVRAFIAIDPGDAVREELLRLQGRIVRELAGSPFKIKWVESEAMHLTLFFLGTQPAERIPEVFQALETAARQIPAFEMTLAAAGFFGRPASPKVFWAGIDAPAELFRLQADLEPLLGDLGVELDTKPFHPHFTLGRIKAGRGTELADLLKKTDVNPVPLKVSSVELFQSELTPEGACHTVLGSAQLSKITP